MPIESYKIGDPNEPRPRRNKKRALETSEEWQSIRAMLAEGITPGESRHVLFTPQQRAELGLKNVIRNLKTMTKAYVKRLGLHYDVEAFKSDNGVERLRITSPIQFAHAGSGSKAIPAAEEIKASKKSKKRA